jgi:hypothetical protein
MEPEWIWHNYVGKNYFEIYLQDMCKMNALSADCSTHSSIYFISKIITSILIGLQRRSLSMYIANYA